MFRLILIQVLAIFCYFETTLTSHFYFGLCACLYYDLSCAQKKFPEKKMHAVVQINPTHVCKTVSNTAQNFCSKDGNLNCILYAYSYVFTKYQRQTLLIYLRNAAPFPYLYFKTQMIMMIEITNRGQPYCLVFCLVHIDLNRTIRFA